MANLQQLKATQPTPQQELWTYLKRKQKVKVAQVLKPLKPAYQEELCLILMDYMELGELQLGDNLLVGSIAMFLIGIGNPDPSKAIIRPLCGQYTADASKGMHPNTDFDNLKK